MHLPDLVARSEHAVGIPELRPLPRLLRRCERVRPSTVQEEELRTVRVTLAAERDHVGLFGAPAIERPRPLMRTPHVEGPAAALQDLAVHDAGGNG